MSRVARALAIACLFAAAPARADDPAAGRTDADRARAAQLFEEGAAEYRAGRFARAVELLTEAHRLAGEPVLLFNLAKAYEGKGDLAAAAASYERYLAAASDIADRGAIEQRVRTLRAELDKRAALERKAAEERARAERAEAAKRRAPSALPWVFAGAGVAGIGAGLALGAFARGAEGRAVDEPVQRESASLRDDAEGLATGANVAFAVGGVLVAGGVAWGLVDLALGSEPASGRVAVAIAPRWVGLQGALP